MKNLLKISTVLMFSLVFFSCNKEDKYEENYTYEQFKELTKNHNERLDNIYNYLVATAKENAQNPKKNPVKTLVLQKILKEFNTLGLTKISNKGQLVMLLSGMYSKFIPDGDKKLLQEFAQKQNPVQLGYIKKIIGLQANSVEEYQQKLDVLMDALAKDTRVNETDRERVYYLAAIAHHSYEYWAKNAPKWKMLLAMLSGKTPMQP